MSFNILTLVLLVIAVGLLLIRFVFSVITYRHNLPPIKSADNNISTSNLEKLALKLKTQLGLDDWIVSYDIADSYRSVTNCVSWKEKTIKVSKFTVPSVGYELDNLFGVIWFASKIIKHEKKFLRFSNNVNIFSPLFKGLFLVFAALQMGFWLFNYYDQMTILESAILLFLRDYNIVFLLAMTMLIAMTIFQIFIYGSKERIEEMYEKEIANFVSTECHAYSQDIVAARVYAEAWKAILLPVVSKKMANLKYLGPFAIYR